MSGRKDGKTEDLKNMLMSFRIAELQTLLASCGRSRSGRKHELLGRAVSLLKSSEGSGMRERVKARILELYHQRYSTGGGAAPGVGITTPADPGGIAPPVHVPTHPNNNSSNIPPASYAQPYLQKEITPATYLNRPNYHHDKAYTSQAASRQVQRSNVMNSNSNMQNNNRSYEPQPPTHISGMPIHPDVNFTNLPFYDIVDVLIKATSLVQKTITGYQETTIVYHLTPYQTQLITNSRSYHVKSMVEYAVQVQLRFCLAETSIVQEDLYPSRCKIIVNGKNCALPGQPPPNAQNQEPRKPHRPVNITAFCRLSPMQSNQIQIQWIPSDLGLRHCASVHLVKIVQVETLIQQLENKPLRSKAHTIGFIKEKLSPDPDSEIAMTCLKVSLCCPIGRTRMKMPCRASNCKHLQCFDGSTYIQMNERKPSWVCPVCDQKAYYNDLFKDGLFTSIISEAQCDDINFFEDGSWRPLDDDQGQDGSNPPPQILSTPKSSNKPPNVDSLTPPVLSVSTPVVSVDDNTNNSVGVKQDALSKPSTPEVNSNGESDKTPEESEVEVIMIDDSDSDSEERPTSGTTNGSSDKNHVPPRFNNPLDNGINHTSSCLPFSDPDLQGLELYNLLPHEDRIAAAMYLDQNGILNQLANVNNNSRTSPTNIIDISDE